MTTTAAAPRPHPTGAVVAAVAASAAAAALDAAILYAWSRACRRARLHESDHRDER